MNTTSHAADVSPPANAARFQWCCSKGCGPCEVKRDDYEYHREEDLQGNLICSKTQPRLVSRCCGAALMMWDTQADQQIDVEVDSPIIVLPSDADSPFTDEERKMNPRLRIEPEAWERREDGRVVRKDRWEVGIRNIVTTLYGARNTFEVEEVVELVKCLATGEGDDATGRPAVLTDKFIDDFLLEFAWAGDESAMQGHAAIVAEQRAKFRGLLEDAIGTLPLVRALRQRSAQLVNRLAHTRYWYGTRSARLFDWAHQELNEQQRRHYFSVVANGTADPMEPPSYPGMYNMLSHENERLRIATHLLLDLAQRIQAHASAPSTPAQEAPPLQAWARAIVAALPDKTHCSLASECALDGACTGGCALGLAMPKAHTATRADALDAALCALNLHDADPACARAARLVRAELEHAGAAVADLKALRAEILLRPCILPPDIAVAADVVRQTYQMGYRDATRADGELLARMAAWRSHPPTQPVPGTGDAS